MCGIAGRVHPRGPGISAPMEAQVLEALSHRGPDARGCWRHGDVTFLHTRLRILDLSERADQPMLVCRGNRSVVGVFNGEIYNFQALREELRRGGWNFRTSSDTEVLLAGFLAWGRTFSFGPAECGRLPSGRTTAAA